MWGDEQNSFGSTDALWKIECDFVPKNEEDDKDFSFTTSYSAFSWSKLLTQDEIKKQQKANFIRIISISVCFDAGRFGSLFIPKISADRLTSLSVQRHLSSGACLFLVARCYFNF